MRRLGVSIRGVWFRLFGEMCMISDSLNLLSCQAFGMTMAFLPLTFSSILTAEMYATDLIRQLVLSWSSMSACRCNYTEFHCRGPFVFLV